MSNKKIITIFTPTFNRAGYLSLLYKSIASHGPEVLNCFKWLVIDDGSTDNTAEVMRDFEQNGVFEVEYCKKDNEGKVSCIKYAYQSIDTEWAFLIDSDDVFLEGALSFLLSVAMSSSDGCVGGVFHRVDSDFKIIGDTFNAKHTCYSDLYNGNIQGDKNHLIRTSIANKVDLVFIKGERYMAPFQLFIDLSDVSPVLFFDVPLVQCSYLEGGLTRNNIKLRYENPKSARYIYKKIYRNKSYKFTLRYKALINFYRFGGEVNFSKFLLHFPAILISLVLRGDDSLNQSI